MISKKVDMAAASGNTREYTCKAHVVLLICDDSHRGAHRDVLAVVPHQDLC